MIATIWIALLVVGQTPQQGTSQNSVAGKTQVERSAPRETIAIRREVSELLRAESSAANDSERAQHVQRMTEIYLEIVSDERFVENSFLQQQRTKLWTRLVRVRDELKRRRSSQQREPNAEEQRAEQQQQQLLASSLAEHLQLASQTLGGPAAVFEGVAGGGPIDFGEELIDLITNTINPDHWNVNGGPGSILFYRPALALVVRARSEVQRNVGEVLGAVRAAP